MAPHSSTLAWKIPTDRGAWQAAVHGVAKSRTPLSDFTFHFSCIGEGNGNPLQCSCLENPRDGEPWWAAVHGVTQSRTRLKRQQQHAWFLNLYKEFDQQTPSSAPLGKGGSPSLFLAFPFPQPLPLLPQPSHYWVFMCAAHSHLEGSVAFLWPPYIESDCLVLIRKINTYFEFSP